MNYFTPKQNNQIPRRKFKKFLLTSDGALEGILNIFVIYSYTISASKDGSQKLAIVGKTKTIFW